MKYTHYEFINKLCTEPEVSLGNGQLWPKKANDRDIVQRAAKSKKNNISKGTQLRLITDISDKTIKNRI